MGSDTSLFWTIYFDTCFRKILKNCLPKKRKKEGKKKIRYLGLRVAGTADGGEVSHAVLGRHGLTSPRLPCKSMLAVKYDFFLLFNIIIV